MTAGGNTPGKLVQLAESLIEFQSNPGKFAIALRQPAVAFAQIEWVLRLAANKAVPGSDADVEPALRMAARFFVRTVLLRPGADHYELLGLHPGASNEAVREHYRLMIRLTHPDFTDMGDPWPKDAATRVNLAHEALTSKTQREKLDAELEARNTHHQQPHPAYHSNKVVTHTHRLVSGTDKKSAPTRSRRSYLLRAGLPAVVTVMATLAMIVLVWTGTEEDDFSLKSALDSPEKPNWTAPLPQTLPIPATEMPAEALPAQREVAEVSLSAENTPVSRSAAPIGSLTRSAVAKTEIQQPAPEREKALTLSYSLGLEKPNGRSGGKPTPGNHADSSLNEAVVVRDQTQAAFAAPDTPEVAERSAVLSETPEGSRTDAEIRSAQTLLTELVLALQSGERQQVEKWIARSSSGAVVPSAFGETYSLTLAGSRVVGIGQVQFSALSDRGPQRVVGSIQLQLQRGNEQPFMRDFRIKAQIVNRDGVVKLSQFSGE